jgi:(2Fe-2S) ferredoxin/predicted O-methyltransferase YrrM
MEPFRYHVYVCDQKKPDGAPCCAAQRSGAVIDALRREVGRSGLIDAVQVTVCGSLGLCGRGPNMVVYPEGIWYSGIDVADVAEIVHEHFVEGRPVTRLIAHPDSASLRGKVTKNRDAAMGAMKAREAAGTVPDDLMSTLRGFQDSRIVLTAIELDLFTQTRTPITAPAIASALATDLRATEIVLNALTAMELLRKVEDRYENAPVAARYLADGSAHDARLSLRHSLDLWETWSTLTDAVRTGKPVPRASGRSRDTEAFIGAMHKNAALRAPLVVRAVGATGVWRMIDIGGGSGAYAIAFAHENADLRATILDTPAVLPIAQRHIAEAGLTDRLATVAGDLKTDELGNGYGLALLSAICHMLGPDENKSLFRRALDALVPGGRLVIHDHILSADKTAPRSGALFAVNMLVNTDHGSNYSEAEYMGWLSAAGFVRSRHLPLPGPYGLIVAERA